VARKILVYNLAVVRTTGTPDKFFLNHLCIFSETSAIFFIITMSNFDVLFIVLYWLWFIDNLIINLDCEWLFYIALLFYTGLRLPSMKYFFGGSNIIKN